MAGEDNEELSRIDRETRRAEGRRKKKKLIEDSGGMRPRKAARSTEPSSDNQSKSAIAATVTAIATATTTATKSTLDKSNMKAQPESNTHPPRSPKHFRHRFGRVMNSAPCRNRPRYSTLAIAVPGSIVANCQTKELRTHLVGQVARAATIYHVDEIVVYDDKLSREATVRPYHKRRDTNKDTATAATTTVATSAKSQEQQDESLVAKFDPQTFFARVLQYCETPQYLRRHFFPMHPDLQFAGLLAPIDAPHHVRADDFCQYREGVVLEKAIRSGGSLVNCGVPNRFVEIPTKLQAGIRCTVKLDPFSYKKPGQLKGEVVSPSAPRQQDGTYWGYTTRVADSIKAVFEDCPFDGGYDLKIGTSERGDSDIDTADFSLPAYQHAMIVFGGVAGIEECIDAEESLKLPGSESHKLFDVWLNIAKYQGSRTIRTEEAVLISLAKLNPALIRADAGTATVRVPDTTTPSTKKIISASRNFRLPSGRNGANEELRAIDFADEAVSEESSAEG